MRFFTVFKNFLLRLGGVTFPLSFFFFFLVKYLFNYITYGLDASQTSQDIKFQKKSSGGSTIKLENKCRVNLFGSFSCQPGGIDTWGIGHLSWLVPTFYIKNLSTKSDTTCKCLEKKRTGIRDFLYHTVGKRNINISKNIIFIRSLINFVYPLARTQYSFIIR